MAKEIPSLFVEELRRLIAEVVREELKAYFSRQESATNVADPNGMAFSPKINRNWLTHAEAATFLKTSPAVLYKLCSKRRIKYSKRGKRNYYKIEQLEKYLSEGEIQTQEEIAQNTRLKPKMKVIKN